MTPVFIGLGANLGDTTATLKRALTDLHALPNIRINQVSALYRSAPVDAAGPEYANAVACLETSLTPLPLLHALQAVEASHGRTRPYHHAPRTLDLDILLYGDQTTNCSELIIPHPRMHERAFVLRPLSELAPQRLIHQQPIASWLEQCADQAIVRLPHVKLWEP